jgi:hypothetical protein
MSSDLANDPLSPSRRGRNRHATARPLSECMQLNKHFDAYGFLNAPVAGVLPTCNGLIPSGRYLAVVEDVTALEIPEEYPRAVALCITFLLDAPKVADRLKRRHLRIHHRMRIELDLNGKVATDVNVDLGQLRAAVGHNRPGVPLGALRGAGPLIVLVEHCISHDGSSFESVASVESADRPINRHGCC